MCRPRVYNVSLRVIVLMLSSLLVLSFSRNFEIAEKKFTDKEVTLINVRLTTRDF